MRGVEKEDEPIKTLFRQDLDGPALRHVLLKVKQTTSAFLAFERERETKALGARKKRTVQSPPFA